MSPAKIRRDKFPSVKPQDYELLRPCVRSGDILLCAGTSAISRMIRTVTNSVWSHVGFILRLTQIDRVMVLESVESAGVRTVPLSHYVKDYKGSGRGYPGKVLIARHADLKDDTDLSKLAHKAVDCFGYPHDADEILRIVARITASKLGIKRRALTPRDKEYICSEYAEECYRSIGIKFKRGKLGFIAPGDIATDPKLSAAGVPKIVRKAPNP